MPWKRAKLLRNVGNAVEALGGHADETAAQALVGRARAEAETVLTAAGLAWTSDADWDAYPAARSASRRSRARTARAVRPGRVRRAASGRSRPTTSTARSSCSVACTGF